MPAAPPAAPPPRPQGWLQSERIGSAPLRSARFSPVRPGSIRRDGTAPPRPLGPTAAAELGVLRLCPNGTGGGRALPPPCPEPRPLITANYSPEAAAAPPCRGPGHPRAPSRPWLCRRALRPRRDRAEPGKSTGPARGGVSAAVGSPVTRCVPATCGDNRPLLISVQRWSAGEGGEWRIMWGQGLGGQGSLGGGCCTWRRAGSGQCRDRGTSSRWTRCP